MNQRKKDRARAVALIAKLSAQHHTVRYIAEALDRAGIPTLSGRPGALWHQGRVWDIQQEIEQDRDSRSAA